MRRLLGLAIAGLIATACSQGDRSRSLVIIAVDGMDPAMLRRTMSAGRAPNLSKLAAQGGFIDLATSNPPQSPVAWSHFITGRDASEHGIYDFLHRDPEALLPYLSTSKAEGPAYVLEMGDYALPVGGGGVTLLRREAPFWRRLDTPVTVVKIPASYPPEAEGDAEVLAGMGTPDLLGTPGLFQVFTDNPEHFGREVSGGRIHPVAFTGQKARSKLDGPPDPLSSRGDSTSVPLEIVADRKRRSALIRYGDDEVLLAEGEWTSWLPVEFGLKLPLPGARGMVRFFLASVDPFVHLYASPVNLDPFDPAQPISHPPAFAADIARQVGRFHTQGMPEDTKALLAGALSEDEFLSQADAVFDERRRMLAREMDRFRGGLLFFYFSSIDMVSHMFWGNMAPDASEAAKKYAHVVPDLYARMDGVIGEVMAKLGDRAAILVMSDHGFAPYRAQVNLNNWLVANGYMVLADAPRAEVLGHIDWSKTRAYALGLNQLYINIAGREKHGIVAADEAGPLMEKIAVELELLTDPDNGERVVSRVFEVEPSQSPDRKPDLIVGFNRGYRSSDDSALGLVSRSVVMPNTSHWNGDHCMDPALVPGVLVSSLPLAAQGSLLDLAPTVLEYLGADASDLKGANLFVKKK